MARIERRRRRQRRTAASKLNRLSPRIEQQLLDCKTGPEPRSRLEKRYAKLFEAHCQALLEAAPGFFRLKPGQRHAFRRTVRRLRYLRELELSGKKQARDRLLQGLLRLQDALGEYQNCLVAIQMFQSAPDSPGIKKLRRTLALEKTGAVKKIRDGLWDFTRVLGTGKLP